MSRTFAAYLQWDGGRQTAVILVQDAESHDSARRAVIDSMEEDSLTRVLVVERVL